MSTAVATATESAAIEGGPRSRRGEPTWEIARFYPKQGEWTEEQYLALEDNFRIEFVDGVLEFLPMPSRSHQLIARFLFRLLDAFIVARHLGETYFMGYPVHVRDGSYREPDILYVSRERRSREKFAEGSDLVIEVVSPGYENRERDLEDKRTDYATGGVPEYWIVDPEQQTITVLTLDGSKYRIHGEFRPGSIATSVLLQGFEVNVTACFDQQPVE
jgi:Uma2 family endonuclease